MATTTQRELMAEIERLGYTYEGHGGSNAVIMRHPTAGRIRIHSTPSDSRYAKNKLTEARRRIRAAESIPGKFVTWLMRKYEIGDDESRELELSITDEVANYLRSHPREGTPSTLVQTWVNDPRVSDVHRVRGSKTAKFTLVGPYYAPDLSEAEEPVQTPQTRREDRQPMDVIIDQLRDMLTHEVNEEVEDLRTRLSLAQDALTQGKTAIDHALDVLKVDHPHTAAESQPEAAPSPR